MFARRTTGVGEAGYSGAGNSADGCSTAGASELTANRRDETRAGCNADRKKTIHSGAAATAIDRPLEIGTNIFCAADRCFGLSEVRSDC